MSDFEKLINASDLIEWIIETDPDWCVGSVRSIIDHIDKMPSAQPEHTSNNDCNGCKFVGCYDTDFPCANCIRKNKDYYAPERRTDEQDSE